MWYRNVLSVVLTSLMLELPIPAIAEAPSGSYINDPGHTRLLWKIQHLGLSNYTARVNDVQISLQYSADNPAESSVSTIIDPTSVDTGYPGEEDFDRKISENPEILNSKVFPEIRFASTAVRALGGERFTIDGELTLLGVTRPIALEAQLTGSSAKHPFAKVPALGFHARASLDRTEFGQTFLSGVALGDVVEIEIQAEFLKQD